MDKIELGIVLRDERERRGWTKTHLAKQAGCSESNIRKMELGHGPYAGLLSDVLTALGVRMVLGKARSRRTLEVAG